MRDLKPSKRDTIEFIKEVIAVPFRNLPVRIGSAYSNRLTLSREQSC